MNGDRFVELLMAFIRSEDAKNVLIVDEWVIRSQPKARKQGSRCV